MKKIVALVLGLALAGSALAGDKMDKKDGKSCCMMGSYGDQLKGFYKDVMNAHKVDAVDNYCAANFTDHNPDPGQKAGLAGLKEAFKGMFAAFPDLKVKVEQVVEQGEFVTARVTMSGTQKGEFMGMPASGKKFKIQGFDMVKINKDGKATDRWGNFDQASMMQQLTPKKK